MRKVTVIINAGQHSNWILPQCEGMKFLIYHSLKEQLREREFHILKALFLKVLG